MKRLLNLCTAALVLAFTSCSTGDDQDLIPMTGDSETLLESSNVDLKTFQSDKLRMFKGPQVQYGDGKLRSFVKLDDENSPVEIGFIMTREVFENTALLPPEDVLTVLPLHQKALEATPYEHLGIKWSQGHPQAFFAQHFDFYFYKISNDERLAIPEYTRKPQQISRCSPMVIYSQAQEESPKSAKMIMELLHKFFVIFLRIDRRQVRIILDEIQYIESAKDYINIVTKDKMYLSRQTISSLEILLNKNEFVRIHRSFIVPINKIKSYTHELVEINKKELPIGKFYLNHFIKLIDSRGL